MDKTDKYYNIIKDIVVNNKKYEGLDDILDNIIDDVYLHSQAIINSITNDSIILAYLEKVVATSIITVPKKFGYKSNTQRKTSISEQEIFEQIKKETIANDNVEKNEKLTDTQLLYVDNMINSSNDVKISNYDENIIENTTTNEISNEFNEPDNVEELIIDSAEEISENVPEIISEDNNDNIHLDISEPDDSSENTFDLIENETSTIEEDVDSIQDNLSETATLALEDSAEQNLQINDENISDDSSQNTSELIESNDLSNLELDSMFDNEDIVSDIGNDLLNNEGFDELVDYEESNVIDTETVSQNINQEASVQQNNNVTKTDYSVFSVDVSENTDISYDIDAIKNTIEEINKNNPDLKIYDIYHLKFKENLNITEIANKLDLNNDIVIDALNQLVDLI